MGIRFSRSHNGSDSSLHNPPLLHENPKTKPDPQKNFQKNFAIRELPLPDGICGDLSTVKIADIIPFKGKIEHLASFERLRVALVGGRPLFL